MDHHWRSLRHTHFEAVKKNLDLVIERFRRQDAIPLPFKRSWQTIVDVLCDAFEAVEKMDLVIITEGQARAWWKEEVP